MAATAAISAMSQLSGQSAGHSFVQTTTSTISRSTIPELDAQLEQCTSAQCRRDSGLPSVAGKPQDSSYWSRGIYADVAIGTAGFGLFWFSRVASARQRKRGELQKRVEEAAAVYATASAQRGEDVGIKGKLGLVEAETSEEESVDVFGATALHRAAAEGDLETTIELLGQGMDVHAREAWDETPLHMAARAGAPEVAEALLDSGAMVDALNADDDTPLLVASKAGKQAVCAVLLDRGATVAGTRSDAELPMTLTAALLERMVQPSSPTTSQDGD